MQHVHDPQPLSPEDQHLMAQARENEVGALNEYLQNRVLILNVEVRRRDARIAELEALLVDQSSDHPLGDVSGDGSGDQPQ
jgi:hypothetical protein